MCKYMLSLIIINLLMGCATKHTVMINHPRYSDFDISSVNKLILIPPTVKVNGVIDTRADKFLLKQYKNILSGLGKTLKVATVDQNLGRSKIFLKVTEITDTGDAIIYPYINIIFNATVLTNFKNGRGVLLHSGYRTKSYYSIQIYSSNLKLLYMNSSTETMIIKKDYLEESILSLLMSDVQFFKLIDAVGIGIQRKDRILL